MKRKPIGVVSAAKHATSSHYTLYRTCYVMSEVFALGAYITRQELCIPIIQVSSTLAAMSLLRACLVPAQAIAYHYAFIPPNPTQAKDRYHTEELHVLQIAPLIFRSQGIVLNICAVFEILSYLATQSIIPSSSLLRPNGQMVLSPLFFGGIILCLVGSFVRQTCFRVMGKLFTFDLTIHRDHQLVTSSFYSIVRHPAYTGSIMLVAGIGLSHLTRGSWLVENAIPCVVGSSEKTCQIIRFSVLLTWWAWTLSVGISRAIAEDNELKRVFGSTWEQYAKQVNWWFFPGLL